MTLQLPNHTDLAGLLKGQQHLAVAMLQPLCHRGVDVPVGRAPPDGVAQLSRQGLEAAGGPPGHHTGHARGAVLDTRATGQRHAGWTWTDIGLLTTERGLNISYLTDSYYYSMNDGLFTVQSIVIIGCTATYTHASRVRGRQY